MTSKSPDPSDRELAQTRIISAEERRLPVPQEFRDLTLPDYALTEFLGKGGMGIVLLARHRRLNRDVAIKMIAAREAAEQSMVQRLEREAQTLAQLDHPNIVACYDVGHSDGYTFIAMQYVPGGRSVEDLIRHLGKIPEDLAVQIIRQTAMGLRYASGRGVLHRDVKPDNLLIYQERLICQVSGLEEAIRTQKARIMIADFGLARVEARDDTDVRLTVDGHILGSPAYMAPEQTMGEELDLRADIYALGVTLYYMLSGKLPLKGSTIMATLQMKIQQEPPPIRSVEPTVSPALARIVMRMIQRNPNDRYADYDKLLADLDLLTPSSQRLPVQTRPSLGSLARVTAVSALVLAAAGGAWWWLGRDTSRSPLPSAIAGPNAIERWTGDTGTWTIGPPDDESKGLALVSPLGESTIELSQDIVPGSRLVVQCRLPNGGEAGLHLRDVTGVRLSLNCHNAKTFTSELMLDGDPRELTPPSKTFSPRDWREIDVRLYRDQILVYLDGELAAQSSMDPALGIMRLSLWKDGGTAQFRTVEITPLKP